MISQQLWIPEANAKATILVVGGCRSGKSSNALKMADQVKAHCKIFVATCIPQDAEMQKRVDRHQTERGTDWQTVESPRHLAAAVRDLSRPQQVLLIDCLTMWLSNLYLDTSDPDRISASIQDLRLALEQSRGPIFLVSNEVGAGIVPENALARQFRDMAGIMNQKMAACAQQVIWSVAGLPVVIKSERALSAAP